jgi:hypothetical protein
MLKISCQGGMIPWHARGFSLLVAAIDGTALLGWILVGVGALLFLIGAAISIVVALRKPPPTEVTAAVKPGVGTIIGWIFKYGGAGAPVMAIGFLLVAIGLAFLGYEVFTWPSS